jgi:putative membrane protein
MLTVLAGKAPIDLASEPAATIARGSFRYAGPTYVVLGALTALVLLGGTVGWRKGLTVAFVASALTLGAELLGTASGLPFGDYTYSGMLGYRIAGLVPFPIPLSWFYMIVGSLVIVARLRAPGRDHPWRWAFMAGLLMVAWDVSMDPAMVKTGHWSWGDGEMFGNAPSLIRAFFTAGVFYGMPLGNWFGWLLTATVVSRVMLALLPSEVVRARLAPSALPVWLYLVNGLMPVAVCLRDGLWWAAASGAVVMALPAGVSLRSFFRDDTRSRSHTGAPTPRGSATADLASETKPRPHGSMSV